MSKQNESCRVYPVKKQRIAVRWGPQGIRGSQTHARPERLDVSKIPLSAIQGTPMHECVRNGLAVLQMLHSMGHRDQPITPNSLTALLLRAMRQLSVTARTEPPRTAVCVCLSPRAPHPGHPLLAPQVYVTGDQGVPMRREQWLRGDRVHEPYAGMAVIR
jgi:hypothetical protein